MDTDHLGSLVRALATTPSRRAVARAFSGLAAGSVLAPLIDRASAAAKKKKKKKPKLKKLWKKACKKDFGGSYCPKERGTPCCDKGEVCTNTPCGCMEKGSTNCCVTNEPQPDGSRGYPCPDDHTCCHSKDYDDYGCCPPDKTCCGGACCGPDLPCCGDVCCDSFKCCGGDTCCPPLYLCCPDGSCQKGYCS